MIIACDVQNLVCTVQICCWAVTRRFKRMMKVSLLKMLRANNCNKVEGGSHQPVVNIEITLPKTNIAPWKDEFPFWEGPFSESMLVSQRVYWVTFVFFYLPWHFRDGFGPSKDICESASPNVQLAQAWLCSILLILPEGNIPPDPWRVYERI